MKLCNAGYNTSLLLDWLVLVFPNGTKKPDVAQVIKIKPKAKQLSPYVIKIEKPSFIKQKKLFRKNTFSFVCSHIKPLSRISVPRQDPTCKNVRSKLKSGSRWSCSRIVFDRTTISSYSFLTHDNSLDEVLDYYPNLEPTHMNMKGHVV